MLREIDLPSGSKLKLQMAPFKESKELYQAVLEELKGVKINDAEEVAQTLKDVSFILFSSKKIEASLEKCLKSCVYDSGKGLLRIDDRSFEDERLREDYPAVCIEVAIENLKPFMKSLYAMLKRFLEMMPKSPA